MASSARRRRKSGTKNSETGAADSAKGERTVDAQGRAKKPRGRAKKPRATKGDLRESERIWGKELIAAGFTILPSVLVERQQALGLEPADLNILLHLIRRWWFADRLPHPSKKSIADAMGVSPSTVQRRIARMERDGLLTRKKRSGGAGQQTSNYYDLSGLIAAARPLAVEEVNRRRAAEAEERRRLRRKRPRAL